MTLLLAMAKQSREYRNSNNIHDWSDNLRIDQLECQYNRTVHTADWKNTPFGTFYHLQANFAADGFVNEIHQKWKNIKFDYIMLDYYRFPSVYLEDREKLFANLAALMLHMNPGCKYTMV